MDIFQGWYKDGTEGTRDYRCLSAVGLLLRIGFSCEFTRLILVDHKNINIKEWALLGTLQTFLGMFYLAAKPYRVEWMCYVDGIILILIGILLLWQNLNYTSVYILGAVISALVLLSVCVYSTPRCTRSKKEQPPV